jgi:CheY-like chemotaxis protein
MTQKILVVDDDADFSEATSTLLRAKGFTVVTAAGGEEGYAKARLEKPHAILLDVMMSHDSEGIDIARRLAEDPATKLIPVIMITGIQKSLGLPAGVEPDSSWLPVRIVLEKPVRPEELLKAVKEALKT